MVVGCISCKDGLGEDFAFCTCGLLHAIYQASIRGTFDEALQMTTKSSGAHGAGLDYPEHL